MIDIVMSIEFQDKKSNVVKCTARSEAVDFSTESTILNFEQKDLDEFIRSYCDRYYDDIYAAMTDEWNKEHKEEN